MTGILRRKQLQSFSIKADAVQMRLVRILILLAAVRQKIHAPVLFIDMFDLPHHPGSLSDLILQPTGLAVEIQVIPAIALRGPEKLLGCVHKTIEGFPWVHILLRLLAQENFLLSGGCIDDSKFFCFVPSLIAVVKEALPVGEPLEAGPAFLGRKVQSWSFYINPRSRLNIENDRLGFGQNFSRQWIHVGKRLRAKLVFRNKLQAREVTAISLVNGV